MFTKFKLSNFINDTTTAACAGFASEVLVAIEKRALGIVYALKKLKLSNLSKHTIITTCAGFALAVLVVIRKIVLGIIDVIATVFSFLHATYDEVNFFSDVDSSSDDETPIE